MFYYKKVDKYDIAENWVMNNLNTNELEEQIKAYDDKEIKQLIKLKSKGLNLNEISIQLCTTESAIKNKWNLFRSHIYGYIQGKSYK